MGKYFNKQRQIKTRQKIQTKKIDSDSHAESVENPDALSVEISKLILSNNLEFIRSTLQTLQSFTSILLTAYIALLVGFRKDIGLQNRMTLFVAFSPIICWSGSLFWGFASAAKHLKHEGEFVYGDLESTVDAYEQVISIRRKQILWPAILSFLGLLCFVISFFIVFLPTLTHPLIEKS